MLFVPFLPIKAAELIHPDISFPLCLFAESDIFGNFVSSEARLQIISGLSDVRTFYEGIFGRVDATQEVQKVIFIFFSKNSLVDAPGCDAFNDRGTFERCSKVFQKEAQKLFVFTRE